MQQGSRVEKAEIEQRQAQKALTALCQHITYTDNMIDTLYIYSILSNVHYSFFAFHLTLYSRGHKELTGK